MDFKEVFVELEKTAEGKALVEGLKAYKSTADQNEKDLRKSTKDLEQFEGVDIAKLKSVSEFVDSHGGQDSILGVVAKANGYEDDKNKMQADIDAKNAIIGKHEDESKAWQAERKGMELKEHITPMLSVFDRSPDLVIGELLGKGEIYYDDNNNVMMKDGNGAVAFDDTAIEKLKQDSRFSKLCSTPNGGGESGGVNGGNPSGGDTKMSYEDEINAQFA